MSSYFFQLSILYIFLRYGEEEFLFPLFSIAALIALSTLNRESSAVSVSIIALLSAQTLGVSKKTFWMAGAATASFIATYKGLRYFKQDEHPIKILTGSAGHPFEPANIAGFCFWVLYFFLCLSIANSKKNQWLIIGYHLLCFPYIYACFKVGSLLELRLYLPMFLGSLLLAKMLPINRPYGRG